MGITTPATRRVRASKDSAVQTLSDGRQMVTVKVNDVIVRLHLIEVKDWSLERATNFKDSTFAVVAAVVQTAHGTTTRIIGHQRATTLFTKLHLPIEIKSQVASIQKPSNTLAVESPKAAKVGTIAKMESATKVKTVVKTASKVVETAAKADAELEGAIAG